MAVTRKIIPNLAELKTPKYGLVTATSCVPHDQDACNAYLMKTFGMKISGADPNVVTMTETVEECRGRMRSAAETLLREAAWFPDNASGPVPEAVAAQRVAGVEEAGVERSGVEEAGVAEARIEGAGGATMCCCGGPLGVEGVGVEGEGKEDVTSETESEGFHVKVQINIGHGGAFRKIGPMIHEALVGKARCMTIKKHEAARSTAPTPMEVRGIDVELESETGEVVQKNATATTDAKFEGLSLNLDYGESHVFVIACKAGEIVQHVYCGKMDRMGVEVGSSTIATWRAC